MIHTVQGDIFNAKTEAIVNPVKCVGVMGKGLALAFKQRYPNNYVAYITTLPTEKPARRMSSRLAVSSPTVSRAMGKGSCITSSTSQQRTTGVMHPRSPISSRVLMPS